MTTKRSIFEDVTEDTPAQAAPTKGVIDSAKRGARGPIRAWLMVLFVLVVVMIAVGGLTRLTDSGLSITEWRPVTGALPPMSAEAWDVEFEKYRAIPEYQLQNKGMSLEEFKVIYWWEWGHRQLGRFIGLVWAVGFFFFLATKRIPTGWTGRLLLPGLLGGLQGAIGWWMVSSGLTGTMLDVASYRLATHLGLAFVILSVLAWYIMLLNRSETDLLQARRAREPRLGAMAGWLIGLAFLQILIGALVAGIDAGRTFTDWPLMAGGFFPPDAYYLVPGWRNFFENPGLVQFIHRMVGYVLIFYALLTWFKSRRSSFNATRTAFSLMMAMMFLQIVLGIVTVLYIAPLHLALIHQFGAVVLITLILRARFLTQYPLSQSLRI
ncbi:MAG: COX15/CtaA family protein [Silicimonas sp.]|nr:COX15/CtaA family protein [Silicimonas sp.]